MPRQIDWDPSVSEDEKEEFREKEAIEDARQEKINKRAEVEYLEWAKKEEKKP